MTHLLPTTPITTEAEALKAAQASAVAIFIGVVFGVFNALWVILNPEFMAEIAAQQEAMSPGSSAGNQMSAYFGYAMIVVQLVLGVVQWRSPNKIIAFIFIGLIILGGLLPALATPLIAGAMPGMPTTPMWIVVLSLVVFVVQLVLHFTGLKGIKKLDQLQMDAAR